VRFSATNADEEAGLAVDNSLTTREAHRPKDVNDYMARAFMTNFTAASGAHNVETQYRRQDTSGTCYVKNSDLLLISLDAQSDTDSNKTKTTYNDVVSGIYDDINRIRVVVNVTYYNNSGSSANGNTNPDLLLEAYNGTSWVSAGTLSVSHAGNYTIDISDSSVRQGWAASTENRDLRIGGIYFDYSNAANFDQINWTDVYVYIDYYNLQQTYWELVLLRLDEYVNSGDILW